MKINQNHPLGWEKSHKREEEGGLRPQKKVKGSPYFLFEKRK